MPELPIFRQALAKFKRAITIWNALRWQIESMSKVFARNYMKILYHIPSLDSIYAHRTIYHGFKNAFVDMGHEFRPYTADDDLADVLATYRPDIFITASHHYYRKYLDFDLLKRFRDEGLFVLVKIDFWNSPMSAMRINEARSLKDDKKALDLIVSGAMGDAFFHVIEQGDQTMHGFSKTTGHEYHTIPLAADKTLLRPDYDKKFEADISYIGSNLPDKRRFFKKYVFPLGREHNLRIYGQDWTRVDQALGWVQRAGQYFNYKPLAQIREPKLALQDEARIYASSVISINVHEKFQRVHGGDCNERTFKIPMCGGFEVVDNVACIKKYFEPGKELIVAGNDQEWVEVIQHYLANPEERYPIIEAGRLRVLRDHTYHNRAQQMIDITNGRNT